MTREYYMDKIRITPETARIRPTEEQDVEAVLRIYDTARLTMRESGNPLQWPTDEGYPGLTELQGDMRRGASYVIEYEGRVVGTFALVPGKEPSYARIHDGRWLDGAAGTEAGGHGCENGCLEHSANPAASRPYCTIHRLAGNPAYSGIASCCFGWCKRRCGSLRSDTHHDNIIMQKAFTKAGFVRCGIILLENGSERTAYQWLDDGKE